jgi:hypothetical protein
MTATIGRRTGEGLILTVYLFTDAIDVWPKSHVGCLVLAYIGILGVLLLDGFCETAFPLKRSIILGAISLLGCVTVYFIAPLFAEQEIEVHGRLEAGAAGPSDCERQMLANTAKPPPNPMNILFGNSGFAFGNVTDMPVLSIASCKVFWVTRDQDGLEINARLYDQEGKLIATINNNDYTAFQGDRSSVDREHDLSQITVSDRELGEILHVEYPNQNTVKLRGVFGCPGHALVRVQDNRPIPNVSMNGACINAPNGITVGDALIHVQ